MLSVRTPVLAILTYAFAATGALAQGGSTTAPTEAVQVPAPTAVEPGTPLEIGIWSLRAGGPGRPVRFTRCLRSEGEAVASGPGRAFALVPLSALNTSMEMDSLIGPTWILHDDADATYAPVDLPGLELAEGAPVDLLHVPIAAERRGFLVFEVPEDVRTLALEFGGFRPGAGWRVDLSAERGGGCTATSG